MNIEKRINAEIQKLDNKITDHHRAMSTYAKAFVSAVSTYSAEEIAKGAGKNLYDPVQKEHGEILKAKEKKEMLLAILHGDMDTDDDTDEPTKNYLKQVSIIRSFDVAGTALKCKEALENGMPIQEIQECIGTFDVLLNELKSGAKCPRCGNDLYLSDLPQYAHVCYHCDENFYNFEVKLEKEAQGNG